MELGEWESRGDLGGVGGGKTDQNIEYEKCFQFKKKK